MATENLAEATATVVDGLPSGETAPQPISVELTEEGVAQPDNPAAKTAADEPKKRGRPVNERIQSLTADKQTLLAELEQERRRSAELEGAIAKKQEELTAGQFQQMALHKSKLQTEAQQARDLLKQANSVQDFDKVGDATAKLARAESGLADVEAWEARNKAPEAKEQPQQREQPQQQQFQPPPQLDSATAGWMDENPWFQPLVNGKPNASFDRSMHLTAVAYASRLEDQYRAQGRETDIAGSEYWNKINNYMAKEFPDRFDVEGDGEEAPTAPAPRQAASPVAPATRSQPNVGGQKQTQPGKVIVQLSGPERAIADQLRSSGALLYSRDHPTARANPHLAGKRMSPDDAYKAYGQQLQRDRADQAQRRANQ